MKKYLALFLLFISFPVFGQELKEATNSFFDESEVKEYSLKGIMVEGEVAEPGMVEFASLPVRNVPVKELALINGKEKFIGSYYYSGYSLFDIISGKKFKKANEADFRPAVDLFVVVENAKGEKAVFSWGEIYYGKDNFQFLISKSVNAINPSKLKMKWPLPAEPRLVAARDAYNVRFISNPVRITIKSFPGTFTAIDSKEIFASSVTITFGEKKEVIPEIPSSSEKRTYKNIGYGHGMGWKGVKDVTGFTAKDVIGSKFNFSNEELASSIVCVSAKDGYRAAYSLSEIMNRSDNEDFLFVDRSDSKEDGKYTFYATPDFFVDRNIRAAERIQILQIN